MVEVSKPKVSRENKLIVITGPTATGKTARAVELAQSLNGEIVSADSRQVYRDMDLGTGKDLQEYKDVAYHLIDICEAGEKYNLHRYIKDFRNAVEDISKRERRVIVCGGSGMYLENALSGISLPEVAPNYELRERLSSYSLEELTRILQSTKNLHNTTDIDTPQRAIRAIEIEEYYKAHPEEARSSQRGIAVPFDALIIGIDVPRDVRRARITKRLKDRLEQGMVEEVEKLLSKGLDPESLIYYGLEYKYLTLFVTGRISYEEMFRSLETAIHQFAKRQMTWFRGMERRGFTIHWLPYDLSKDAFLNEVTRLLVD